ncbi:transposase [Xanthomonas campestris]|uniref:transposase n=1 Tax=Xanthomonas campestris TaxID=339 RepID=UPI001ED8F167|nr:transposase [Xanthomonas campestris]MEA9776423.1 transposase [Xanthomonas campestris pv. raphani]MEA9918933.1 transposase [Xanthomonas campestris pv. raphani]
MYSFTLSKTSEPRVYGSAYLYTADSGDDGDRVRYLHLLHEALHATGCQLHAYGLMNNHVYLLATPPAIGRIGQLMQRLGRNYVALFNGRHGRTGTL